MISTRCLAQFYLVPLAAFFVVAVVFVASSPTFAQDELLIRQISHRLGKCWNPDRDGVPVTLSWRLRRDGTLDGEPRIESQQANPLFLASADAAIRAIKACAPFKLPPDKYELWKSVVWDFHPIQAR